jgi:GNAT superfamily N-acetyltransferase
MRETHSSRGSRTAHARRTSVRLPASAFAALLIAAAAGSMHVAAAQTAPGTSGQGIVPIVLNGGNQTCADVPSATMLSSSERLEVQGNSLRGTLPEGLEVVLASNKRSISWTSTFPITAVIVKGGDAANVYVYAPPLLADTGLRAPVNQSGQAADISNVTFCWDENGGNGVDLQALCLSEATKADVGDIVSFAGPIVIEDGIVDMTTVPAGFGITYDAMSEQIAFTAPWPVVVAMTSSPAPVAHLIDPPSTTGSVPLASDPGDGELVLCGLDTSVVAAASCAQVDADAELGPIEIREATMFVIRDYVDADLSMRCGAPARDAAKDDPATVQIDLSQFIIDVTEQAPTMVAVAQDEIVGLLTARTFGTTAWILTLAVSQTWRQQGVGTGLVERLEQRLARRACAASRRCSHPARSASSRC